MAATELSLCGDIWSNVQVSARSAIRYNSLVLKRFEFQVPKSERRTRLEDFLFDRFGELSRMYLRDVVKGGLCQVNGRFENVGYRLRPDDFVEIELDPTRAGAMRPENIPLNILFEDEDILVVEKPVGMLVHPTHRDKSGTLLNGLSYHLNKNQRNNIRPGLVHRLDKHTSGLMVIAKNLKTHRSLASQFHRKLVEKKYIALVDGVVSDDHGTIERPVGRFEDLKLWDVKTDGKHSMTRFRVIERRNVVSLLELEPVTGRTNQLRIHCAAIGHPIVGDTERGATAFSRLCLHAFRLSFRHPTSRDEVRFESAMPEQFLFAPE